MVKTSQKAKKSFTLAQTDAPERIAKRIARAGICSRREAEALILTGRVKLNGEILNTAACIVTAKDWIEVDDKRIPTAEPVRLWRYCKPRGLVVSNRDEKGRKTIFDHLPENLPRVISVGRLDIDSEGLLLLTNDGGLARHLELPSTGWTRKYRVRVRGLVDPIKLDNLTDGVRIDGIHYGEVLARLDSQMPSNAWLTVAIKEGKNREIRHIMDYLGYPVNRLLRLSYGPFSLGNLEEGDVMEVKTNVLAEQLGLARPQSVSLPLQKPKSKNIQTEQRQKHKLRWK
jgi:23S rRNA pseudouridine2605 synthase